ncbi:MAG TPA: prephenate dehydratase [Blastocatellia bacterium]|nr:prephenate dehydratase [Blastocatellia bacterium]
MDNHTMSSEITADYPSDSPQPRVAFQGEMGAFSTEAARKLLGNTVTLVPCESFERMFATVERGEADYCLAPIENSLFGSVFQNYDLLLKHHLRIRGEVNLRIVHNLIVAPGTKFEDVRRVYSHQVALGQCQQFLAANPQMLAVAAYDTAGSVKMIMESREAGAAAIASAAAAEVYGAQLLVAEIEDDQQNFTRFLLLSPAGDDESEVPPPEADKTSIVFSLENRTGSLYRAMAVFALRDIDLTKIESRPLVGRPWEYSFYLDFIGNTTEPGVRNALAHLAEFATSIKVLGCYPKATK